MKVLGSSPELFEEITMPRLELTAALLLTQLTQIVKKAYGDKIQEIHLWSDSIITLCWIATPPGKLRTYELNRVKKVQDMTEKAIWHYVPTRDNSADLLSRGTTAEKLLSSELWWKGPTWLLTPSESPKSPVQHNKEIPGLKKDVVSMVVYVAPKVLKRFQHYGKLQRVIGYCIRFIDIYVNKEAITEPLTKRTSKS